MILWPQVEAWLKRGRTGSRPQPHVYTSADYQRHEQRLAVDFALQWRRAGRTEPLDEPATLLVLAMFPRPKSITTKRGPNTRQPHVARPDADNVAKTVCDALQAAGVLRDDSRLWDVRCIKLVCAADEEPRVEVRLRWGGEPGYLRR